MNRTEPKKRKMEKTIIKFPYHCIFVDFPLLLFYRLIFPFSVRYSRIALRKYRPPIKTANLRNWTMWKRIIKKANRRGFTSTPLQLHGSLEWNIRLKTLSHLLKTFLLASSSSEMHSCALVSPFFWLGVAVVAGGFGNSKITKCYETIEIKRNTFHSRWI